MSCKIILFFFVGFLFNYTIVEHSDYHMEQPELGKKIAELRKQKGLTQEELVNNCNLSVRTLQRIEAGEVTPRAYTIKLIFNALDYDFYNSPNNTSDKSSKIRFSFNWLKQFYNHTINLFNLKTNTMKKLLILSVPIILIFLFIGFQSSAQRRLHKKMIGTWQLCNKDSTVNTNFWNKGFIRYKTISENSFMNADIQKEHKTIHNTIWGTYLLKNHIYTEFVEYTSYGYNYALGQRNSFEVEIKGDLMFLNGLNEDYGRTIWKRVKCGNP